MKAKAEQITAAIADQALAMLEIDEQGLDEMDKRILETLVHKFGGKPVGAHVGQTSSASAGAAHHHPPCPHHTHPNLPRSSRDWTP